LETQREFQEASLVSRVMKFRSSILFQALVVIICVENFEEILDFYRQIIKELGIEKPGHLRKQGDFH
jgi:hypothetical protein